MTQATRRETSVEVVATPIVNYAMAHGGVAFLHRVVITFPDDAGPADGVVVGAEVRDAEGVVISRPWQHHLDSVRTDVPLVIDNPGVRLDPQHMADLEEETAAEIVVTVTVGPPSDGGDGGDPVTVSHTPIRVLAARQWAIDPAAPVLSLELLASFVQPNHPAVAPVVARAARHLADHTRSGSLAVAHVDPERIDAIVEAVFLAVHDLEIYYAAPPASWGYGQKVRTPGDVFGDRVGTCLDTTVALAACLEHIGIGPVLWIARGHAFLGYWRREESGLPDAASLQVATAANAVDLGLLGVVETTMVTRERRPPRDLFRRASQAPRDAYFLGGSSELVGVVDVGMARMMRVLPLPARRVRADGVVEVVEYRPPAPAGADPQSTAHGIPGMPPAAAGSAREPSRPLPPPRVRAWKNALLDLTLRNKLLNMDVAMTRAPLLTPSEHLGVLAAILQDGRTVSIRAVDDLGGALADQGMRDAYALPGDIQRSMLVTRSTIYSALPRDRHLAAMNRLRYRARTAIQETGANPLFVTLGRLDWKLGDRELSAPLLLAPVEIRGVVMPFRVGYDESGAVTLNRSLMEKLRLETGFVVDGLDELPARADGEGVDVDAVIRRVREAIASSGLAFRVESEAQLAIIGFTGYLLWRDLDEHWETFLERPLVRHLATTPTDSFSGGDPPLLGDVKLGDVKLGDVKLGDTDLDDTDLDDVVASAPVPTDGSQARAVAAARSGRTFVLEGPPGTGKSQTITGILADQMAQGRRVLFVAEKGAALDVVRRRLADVGLLPFALDLHDEGARPAEVRARLRTALAHRAQPDADGYRMAAVDVASSGTVLEGYAVRLHARNRAGLSLYTARGQELARGAGPTLTVPQDAVVGPSGPAGASRAVSPAEASAVTDARRAVLDAVPLLGALTPAVRPPWGFAASGPTSRDALWAAVDEVDRCVAAAREALAAGTAGAARARAAVEATTGTHDLEAVSWLVSASAADPVHLVETRSERWRSARDELSRRSEALREAAGPLLESYAPDVIGIPVDDVRQAVRVAAASFFIGRKGRLVASGAPLLAHLRPGARVEPRQLPVVVEQVAALVAQNRAVVDAWRSLPGCGGIDPATNLVSDGGRHDVASAVAALDRDGALLDALGPATREAVVAARQDEPPLTDRAYGCLVDAVAALRGLFALTGTGTDDEARFAADAGLLPAWELTRAARHTDRPRASSLARWVDASEALEPLRPALDTARWELLCGVIRPEDASAALDRSVAAASVQERWHEGGFDSFDPVRHDQSVVRFVTSSDRLRASLATALPAALLERRPFRPGAFFGKVGALEREIGRTRGGLSVRRLVEQYGDVIGAITPCVLVSPDSLARFVPPGSMDFDLVVFDEASQITVADAVGALGRAEAAVIAGDSRQMPPSSFAGLGSDDRGEVEAEFTVVPDEESILNEATHAGVDRIWLSWHYRSQDESLIAFSNAAYYENRLSSFPAHPGQAHDTGISFTRVPGRFLRSGDAGTLRTNPVEAAAVVAEVLRRWSAREHSVGVVTFNIQQRALIESMLWESGVPGVAESLAAGRDGIFVKNLENVQGDERDVILFSTGFSANEHGLLPLNFGPLNRTGGERRLNVAVTRARRRVMVFSSFEPEDLRVEETSSVGIRDLRRYLEVAKYGVESTLGAHVRVDGSAEGSDGYAAAPARAVVDRHRDDIAAALTEAGLGVRVGVGLSDFQVDLAVGPAGEEPSLAVLLDSPTWAARSTTADRDALPTTVLERVMGWPAVARIWLPAWLEDRDRVVADISARALEAARRPRVVGERVATTTVGDGAGPQDVPVQDTPAQDGLGAQDGPDPLDGAGPQDGPGPLDGPGPGTLADAVANAATDLYPADEADDPPAGPPGIPGLSDTKSDPVGLTAGSTRLEEAFVPFVSDVVARRSALDGLGSGRGVAAVQALVRDVVETEGPVSMARLARLVARAHGLTRVVDHRVTQIAQVVPRDLRRDPEEGFVWPERRDPLRWRGFRRYDGLLKDRPLDDVALREIGNAMAHLVGTAMGIGVDELVKETFAVFGGARVTAPVRARMTTALDLAVREQRVLVVGGVVVPRAR